MCTFKATLRSCKEIRIMKLFMAIIGWDYEGGMVLGVYDTEQEAEDRIKEYSKDGRYGDRQEVITLTLNTNEEIDI